MNCDYEELYKWVEEHPISRPKRNIHRDFSDAIPLVEILKHHYPKMVQPHNYSPKNSFQLKQENWETLNNKILKKLQIPLSKKRIELLAKGEPGAIEKLLIDLKKKIDTKGEGDEASGSITIEEIPTTPTSMNSHTKKSISIVALDKIKKELGEKNEAITVLKTKVDHLESLLSIKEERIKDLTQQLQSIVNQSTSTGPGDQPSQSKFFKLF